MKNNYLLGMILLFLTIQINAQSDFLKGYIVLKNNSRIEGYIDNNSSTSNSRNCYFKNKIDGEIKKYSPNEISEYAMHDYKRYVARSVNIDGIVRHVFLEYLLKGALDVLYMEYSNSDFFYVEKNGELQELTNDEQVVQVNGTKVFKESKKYVGILKYLMYDAKPTFVKGINRTSFNHKSLINVAKKYHNQVCDSVSCIEYTRKIKKLNTNKWVLKFGIVTELSINSNRLKLQVNDGGRFSSRLVNGNRKSGVFNEIIDSNSDLKFTSVTIIPGVFATLGRNTNWTFGFGLRFNKISNSLVEFNELLIPLSISYDFGRYNKLVPFVNFGITRHLYSNISLKESIYTDVRLLSILSTSQGAEYTYTSRKLDYNVEDFFGKKSEFSKRLGAGLKYKVSKDLTLISACNYVYRSLNEKYKGGLKVERTYTSLNASIGAYYTF